MSKVYLKTVDEQITYMKVKIPDGKQSGNDQMRGTCPYCNKANDFVYSLTKENLQWKCHRCEQTGNVLTFVKEDNQNGNGLNGNHTTLEKKVLEYHKNKPGKKHRLCKEVINNFGLKLETYISKKSWG